MEKEGLLIERTRGTPQDLTASAIAVIVAFGIRWSNCGFRPL
jgi:hypothetical protein